MKKLLSVLAVLMLVGMSTVFAAKITDITDYKSYCEMGYYCNADHSPYPAGTNSDIKANEVVLLDATRGVTGSTLGIYVERPFGALSDSVYVMGVAEDAIPTGKCGRIVTKGVHYVNQAVFSASDTATGNNAGAATNGAVMGTASGSGTSGVGKTTVYSTSDGTAGGQLGMYVGGNSTSALVNINPRVHK